VLTKTLTKTKRKALLKKGFSYNMLILFMVPKAGLEPARA
jgi:hypothetical protein